MTLYTIYESSGEIYELKDSGECGGQIGVSSLFVFLSSLKLMLKQNVVN